MPYLVLMKKLEVFVPWWLDKREYDTYRAPSVNRSCLRQGSLFYGWLGHLEGEHGILYGDSIAGPCTLSMFFGLTRHLDRSSCQGWDIGLLIMIALV